MKFCQLLFLVATTLSFHATFAQTGNNLSDDAQIIQVINKYISGTSYNNADQLHAAFIPGANMFLDHKDKPLFVMKIEEYAERVSKHQPGIFNGRVTNILSIDRFQGIAMAKLEVIIPSMERRFIDMVLLKKLDDGWKIISKTAGSEASNKQGKKVLLVVSNARFQGSSELPAGNSFSEIVIAYDEYQKAGYHVELVSPLGGAIPLAYINPSNSLQSDYLYDVDFIYQLKNTKNPSEIIADEYDIVQFTGGSAPIFDVPQNQKIQEIAMHIYSKKNGVVAAVCHGTAGLINLKTADDEYLVYGKNVNGVPDNHESKKLPHYEQYPFIIEDMLVKRGGHFKHSDRGQPHIEVDGKLVTGQNSLSSRIVSIKSIELSRNLSE